MKRAVFQSVVLNLTDRCYLDFLVLKYFTFLLPVCTTINTHASFQEGGDPEKLKLRQKLKAREWDELMSTKKKMKVLEPVVRGCVWDGEGPALQLFQPYAMCLVEPLPKADTSPSPEELSQRCQTEAQCKYMTGFTWLFFSWWSVRDLANWSSAVGLWVAYMDMVHCKLCVPFYCDFLRNPLYCGAINKGLLPTYYVQYIVC